MKTRNVQAQQSEQSSRSGEEQVYGSQEAAKLSQLSDLVSLEDPLPSSLPLGLIEVAHSLSQQAASSQVQPELPSQPLLSTPQLPEVIPEQSEVPTQVKAERPSSLEVLPTSRTAMNNLQQEPRGRGSRSRATRRGPMDEMRQLVRILVKVIPQSIDNIKSSEEGGGGNRISEEQIKAYLEATLGDAPRPQWGVPDGWGSYLAGLFTWVTGRLISQEDAMRCAKREPGRSWEAVEPEMERLGIAPSTWPLPLKRNAVCSAPALAQLHAQPDLLAARAQMVSRQPSGGSGSSKRSLDSVPLEAPSKRPNVGQSGSGSAFQDLGQMHEEDIWHDIVRLLDAAQRKAGTSLSTEGQANIARLRAEARAKLQAFSSWVNQPASPVSQGLSGPVLFQQLPAAQHSLQQLPQAMPVLVKGPDGQIQTAYQVQVPQSLPLIGVPAGVSAPESADVNGVGSASLHPSQFLLSQPGPSSAFQSVKPGSPDRQPSGSLEAPPPLRLSPKQAARSPASPRSEPSSPSTDCIDQIYFPGLTSPPASTLYKPLPLKADPLLSMGITGSQPEQEVASSQASAGDAKQAQGLVGAIVNGQYVAISAAPAAGQWFMNGQGIMMQGQPVSVPLGLQPVFLRQPATSSQALDASRLQQQAPSLPWLPSLSAALE